MELLGSCTGFFQGHIGKLSQMVISRSESAYRYFLPMHSRLVSVAQIFLGSAGPGLTWPLLLLSLLQVFLDFDFCQFLRPFSHNVQDVLSSADL